MNQLSVGMIFSDNMIIQREKDFIIWGTGSNEEVVTISIQGRHVTVPIVNGKWKAVLPPLTTSFDEQLKVATGKESILIHHVAVGEVWLAGGQSNMEFSLRHDALAKDVMAREDNPYIRFFDYPEVSYEGQLEEADYSRFGYWRTSTPLDLEYFSAVAYHFAYNIYQSMNIPIGIIGCNWGGSPASTWIKEDYMERDMALNVFMNEYEDAMKDLDINEYERRVKLEPFFYKNDPMSDTNSELMWKGITCPETEPRYEPMGPLHPFRPAGLYHTMLEHIIPYGIRGVIWYQGESDADKAAIYHKTMAALIQCWRDSWEDSFPFLFVQLAPFGEWLGCSGDKYPYVREQQELVSKTVKDTYMACIMDAGMERDIHPKKKHPVGERLALLARGHVYGEPILCDSPEIKHIKHTPLSLTLEFYNSGEYLILNGEVIQGLQIYSKNQPINHYHAAVIEKEVHIYFDQEYKDLEVRFGFTGFVEINLYNNGGLPVKPLRRVIA